MHDGCPSDVVSGLAVGAAVPVLEWSVREADGCELCGAHERKAGAGRAPSVPLVEVGVQTFRDHGLGPLKSCLSPRYPHVFADLNPETLIPAPIAFPGPHTPLVAGATTQQHQGNLLEVRALPWPWPREDQ